MIGVITASKTSGSVLGYDFGDKKKKDQKIHILASEGVFMDPELVERLNQNWTDDASKKEFKYVSRAVADDLSKQFDSQASLSDRIVKTTGHIALSFPEGDRERLQDDDFAIQIATEYMEKMEINDTQWVLTAHLPTPEQPNLKPHFHLAYNRVRYDGSVIDSKNERYRSQKIAAELSEKYGLTPAGESPRLEQSLSPVQQQFEQMRLMAREALKQSCTMEEFKMQLRERGIELRESEHSEQQKTFGLSYSMIDNQEISAKGSKLDRSALSYAKVTATLEKNLATRTAMEQKAAQDAAREEIQVLRAAYSEMVPTIQKLHASVNNTFQLYTDAKQAGVSINAETKQRYSELKQSWEKFRSLNADRKAAKAAKEVVKAIGGMMILLNPIAGLMVLAIGSIAANIRISNIDAEKKVLLSKIEKLKTDIDALKQQKSDIKIEKQERLKDYLQAKDARNDFRQGMDTIKAEIAALKVQTTKKEVTMDDLARALTQSQKTKTEAPQAPAEKKPVVENPNLDGRIIGSLGRKNIAEVRQALWFNDIVLKPILRQDGAITSFDILHAGKRYKMEDILKPSTILVLMKNWVQLTGLKSAQTVDAKTRKQPPKPQRGYKLNENFRDILDNHVDAPEPQKGNGRGW